MIRFTFLLVTIFTLNAHAECPDLRGLWLWQSEGKTTYLKILKDDLSYILATGASPEALTWKWNSIADGKSYPKELSDQYQNVAEKATCRSNALHRSLTGEWINSEDIYPFDLEVDIYFEANGDLHWHSDFTGYGMKNVIYDYIYKKIR